MNSLLARLALGVGVVPRGALFEAAWDAVPERVLVSAWGDFVAPYRGTLAGIAVAGMPDVASGGLEAFGRRLPLPERLAAGGEPPTGGLYAVLGAVVLDTALAVALRDAGWMVTAAPGDPIACSLGTERIEPMGVSAALASGDPDRDAWRERCERAGIAGLWLDGRGTVASPVAAAA